MGDDRLVVLGVMSLVWSCEFFTTISCRSRESILFFPRFFLLMFVSFHIYYFECPFGFYKMALITFSVGTQWLVVWFLHHYELPAISDGRISPTRPRAISFPGTREYMRSLFYAPDAPQGPPAIIIHTA